MKRFAVSIAVMFLVAGFAACGGDDSPADLGTDPGVLDTADTPQPSDVADVPDVTTPDAVDDPGDPDVVTDVPEDVPMVLKHFTFRTVAGMSMGAMALTVAAHHPEWFDAAGGLGGYIDFRYLAHMIREYMGGGFCPLDQLLQPDVLADINNPDNPLVFCGTANVKKQPWEYEWDFNHFHFDTQGGTWDRDFYNDVLESMAFAYGNIISYNPDHPLLPPGVQPSELLRSSSDRCANPVKVGKPYNYNVEYNPQGTYDLVGYCDGETPVGCYQGDPNKCGKLNPDFRKLTAAYDPAHAYSRPVPLLLSVDLNANGRHDYGEPMVINMSERWSDWGVDGCPNVREDGDGGCSVGPNAAYVEGTDPNGDDFDLLTNPGGTEGNYEYDEDEIFSDLGLDGLAESAIGFKDFGEGDGKYTNNPNLQKMIDADSRSFFRKAPIEVLKEKQYYFDGGIRDALHALTHMVHAANALTLRGINVKRYMDFGGNPDAMLPNSLNEDVMMDLGGIDWSRKSFGDAAIMGYGDPTADPLSGSGGHVGNGTEVSLRAGVLYTMTMARLPDAMWVDNYEFDGRIEYRSYYSEILGQRRWYAVNLPPEYDSEVNATTRYPLGLILPGVGMPLKDTIAITAIMNLTWGYGTTPRFVLMAPDGQCCYRKDDTGERYCNCYKDDAGMFTCSEAQCKGTHEECAITKISRDGFTQECNSGHFFVNQVTNRWGEDLTKDSTNSFEDALFEVIRAAEQFYRLKEEADVLVPADFPDRLPPHPTGK